VFLSLILLLIMSLLFTIIEGARVSTAKVYAERALTTAMDSMLAEYYGPLWEEYHIFGCYTGEDSENQQLEQMEADLQENMSYTFQPGKGLDARFLGDGTDLFHITADKLSVTERTDLLDYDGKLLINEAVEYMKYREIGDGIEVLLNKLTLLDTPGKVSYLIEEKQKVEEELVGIDQGLLELMELFDGLITSKKGIKLTSDGILQTTPYFIKRICYQEVTMENVGINHEKVFQAQKSNYINPDMHFNRIRNDYASIDQLLLQTQELQKEKEKQELRLSEARLKLSILESKTKKTEKDLQQIKDAEANIKVIQAAMDELESRITDIKERIAPLAASINCCADNLIQLIGETKPLINKAITCIDTILVKSQTVAPLMEQYEAMINSEKSNLDENVLSGLEDGLTELKKYITPESGYDFAEMKAILENNRSTLTMTESILNQAKEELNNAYYENAQISFDKAAAALSSYQIDGLVLDYSTLVLDKTGGKSPIDQMGGLLQNGITGLVMDQNSISTSELITSELLPSEEAAMASENTDYLSAISSFINNVMAGGSNFNIGSLFDGNGSQIISVLGNGTNEAAKKLLFQEYLKEHFNRYQAENTQLQEQKPSVLTYEQEYLLAGRTSDQANLSSVVSRIVCLRTILDFASILGDSARREEAKLAATALVGFTGLPILISITQLAILIAWAFAEALLDTNALMMGKNVPILKKNIVLKLPELFLINHDYLSQKADRVAAENELSFSYQDYLRVFLLLSNEKKLAYRSMDLMQEDIRLRYQQNQFRVDDCLFGYEVEAEFIIEKKFTGISFVQNYFNNRSTDFRFTVKAAYSY